MFNSEDNDAFILVVLLYSNAHRLGIVNSINLVCCAFCNKLLFFPFKSSKFLVILIQAKDKIDFLVFVHT